MAPGSGGYAGAFGEQWNRWPKAQLDSHTGVPISRERLFRCLAPELVDALLTYYRAHPELADHHQREWAILDTHDHITDWYKHLRTSAQVEETLRRLGASGISCIPGGNGVEARCRRPG